MKVTLIYPLLSKKRSIVDENKQYWPPLGLAYIAAVLEEGNHEVQIIDRDVLLRQNNLDFDKVDDLMVQQIEDFDTDYVGITATTPNIPDVLHISSLLKKSPKEMVLVLGGCHASGEPEPTLSYCKDIDLLVNGDGEHTMLDIVNGKALKDINGLLYRDGDKIVTTPDRELLKNLDDLPMPAWHLMDMAFYTRPNRFTSRNLCLKTTAIFTARGCPYKCTFCAGPTTFKGKVRFHSTERVIAEIEHLVNEYGIEALFFAEDMFLSSKKRSHELLNLFMEKGLHKKLKWFAQIKVSLVTKELLELMKKSGCVSVEFGFESGSQRVLDLMNKNVKLEDNYNAARLAKEVGIRFQGNIIVGYPGETEDDFMQTLKFVRAAKPHSIGFNIFMPLPGTAAYNELKAAGKKLPRWEDIGDPEIAQESFADMPEGRFEQLYHMARFKVILPINLYYFIKDNMKNPFRGLFVLLTQFNGVLMKSFRAMIRLTVLKAKGM